MTDPTTPPPQPAGPQVPVQVSTDLAPGPDGQPWVKLQLTLGLTATVMLIPEGTADQLAVILGRDLAAAAANARRARTGLIVPGNVVLPPTPPNGGRR